MKISINSAIFNAVAARMTSTAAKYTAIAVQKGVADSKELSGLTALASELPFFANLKEKATKIVTISKEAEQLNIEINDDYIIGSINLGFDLYDRVADSAVSMIKEIDIWNKESKQFEAKWAEEPTTADKVIGIILEVQRAKAEHERVTGLKTDTLEVKAAEDKPSAPIYVGDLDRQVMISALVVTRAGEDIPYELSFLNVRSICQTTVDPLYYDAKQFDLPLDVLNAVRATYSIPPFFTKEQVEHNVAEKEAADKLAREQAREKAKQEQEAAKVAEQTQQQDTNQPE